MQWKVKGLLEMHIGMTSRSLHQEVRVDQVSV